MKSSEIRKELVKELKKATPNQTVIDHLVTQLKAMDSKAAELEAFASSEAGIINGTLGEAVPMEDCTKN